MSSKDVGIEEARKRLGDLITAAQQGTEIVITRNGKPAARIVAIKEPAMTTTTATTYGADFSRDHHENGIRGYLNGGEYTPAQEDAMADALFAEFAAEVDERLPEDVSWHPSTSEFVHPVDADLPDHEEMDELFRSAWSSVEERLGEIEEKTLA